MGIVAMADHMEGGRQQGTLSNTNNVSDSQCMKHVDIRCVVAVTICLVRDSQQGIRCTHRFPKYRKGKTRLGKLPSKRGSLNQLRWSPPLAEGSQGLVFARGRPTVCDFPCPAEIEAE
jgi:hypothetical protein